MLRNNRRHWRINTQIKTNTSTCTTEGIEFSAIRVDWRFRYYYLRTVWILITWTIGKIKRSVDFCIGNLALGRLRVNTAFKISWVKTHYYIVYYNKSKWTVLVKYFMFLKTNSNNNKNLEGFVQSDWASDALDRKSYTYNIIRFSCFVAK